MSTATVLMQGPITVMAYRCEAGHTEAPYVEVHASHSLSYVRRGTFGYHSRGASFEMTPGCLLVGRGGDEFVCTHDHHLGGDECLSLQFSDEWLEASALPTQVGSSRAIPPLPELMMLGELALSCAEGGQDIALEEAALFLVSRFLSMGTEPTQSASRIDARTRRRMVEAALWIEEHTSRELTLEQIARTTGMSACHFLRVFSRVLGVTPHQYLLRSRLRRAARLLTARDLSVTEIAYAVGFGDLSNFTRTFQRAAGVSPRAFRNASARARVALAARPEAALD